MYCIDRGSAYVHVAYISTFEVCYYICGFWWSQLIIDANQQIGEFR